MSATNRGAIRSDQDFYPTPESAFKPLLPYIPNLDIWEPACGDRRLVRWMCEYGLPADGSDLTQGRDFLREFSPHSVIVTNPPYSLAMEFAIQSLAVAEHIFLLLRLNFLASRKRREWFKVNEPSALFVLSERPSFTGRGTDATDYAWYYWGDMHRGIYHL